MEILKALIPIALLLGLFFVVLFIWAARSGQFDDLDTPSQRMLLDDEFDEINDEYKQNMNNQKRKEV